MLESARFLGIDLGWQSQPSGLCCLQWKEDRLHRLALDRVEELDEVLHWVEHWSTDITLIAVDAPTVIPNQTGMRLADRLTHHYFGKYHAGAYPANLSRPFAQRTVGFSQALEALGFDHGIPLKPKSIGRYQIEVFPHPAMIHLFALDRIVKYKKGTLADRRDGLCQLRDHIQTWLPRSEPPLPFDHPLPPIPAAGKNLKSLEDQLDSLVCAYIAAHWWFWGDERNWVLGNRSEGYIVVPAPHQKMPP